MRTATTEIPDLPKDILNEVAEGMLSDVYRKYGRKSDAQLALRNFESGIARMRELEQSTDVEQPVVFRRVRENYR